MSIYLSQLRLNIHSRDVRRDLADPYDMHRTLMRAAAEEEGHPLSFLWRLEPGAAGDDPVALVQAEEALRWGNLPAQYVQSADHRQWNPEAVLAVGRPIRFRVAANPTVHAVPPNEDNNPAVEGPARGRRKRLGLWREAEQQQWIQRQCLRIGLEDVDSTVVSSGALFSRRKPGHTLTVCTALFEGQGRISDPVALAVAIRNGIGHARMLGLGLLSIAPLQKP